MNFTNIIFNLFGGVAKQLDVNKDLNGRGTYERFVELYGICLDREVVNYIDNLVDTVGSPELSPVAYLYYFEQSKGIDFKLYNTPDWRRKIFKYIHRLHEIKGTKQGYRVMFAMLGISVTFIETFINYGFDSAILLDAPTRTLDQKYATFSNYSLELVGTVPTNSAIIAAIEAVIKFNQPINAKLLSYNYSGDWGVGYYQIGVNFIIG